MNRTKNYLDHIPIKNPIYAEATNEDGKLIVKVQKTGFREKISKLLFQIPKVTNIRLDEYGTYVWHCIDGERTISMISEELREEYGEEVEPKLSRLEQYFRVLYANHFVTFRN